MLLTRNSWLQIAGVAMIALPQIVGALMGAAAPESLTAGYDDLFVVTLNAGAPPRLLRLRYGAVATGSH